MIRIVVPLLAGVLLLGACSAEPEPPVATGPGTGSGYTGGGTGGSGMGTGRPGYDSTAVGQARPGTQEHLRQTVGDRILFDTDQYTLSSEARGQVGQMASWLNQFPSVSAVVEGHADERGTREYNLALGERRATSMRDYLVSQGVSPNRLRTVSYGKERPEVLGSNESAWAQNRRGVLTVQ